MPLVNVLEPPSVFNNIGWTLQICYFWYPIFADESFSVTTNAPIPLGYDLFPTMPTSADLGTYAPVATIGNNVPFLYSDYAGVMPATL